MNRINLCAALLLFSAAVAAQSVTESKVWTENFTVSGAEPTLRISNIWGTVRVRPGPAGQISVTVDETRSAPDQERFDRSLLVLNLDIQATEDEVSIVVGEPTRRWQRTDPCRGCRVDYQFDVTVPEGTKLELGTVLDGAIDVGGVAGTVSASNVNGPIRAHELSNCENLESVNGELDVSFGRAPASDCDIETINGDINLSLPNGSGLDVALDQFNGRMVSEFDVDTLALPATVEKSTEDGGTRYRIQQSAGLRLDGGGPMFSISSLNGDVRIRKTQ
jgi:hypothetical protein